MKRAACIVLSLVAFGACGGGSSGDFHEKALRAYIVREAQTEDGDARVDDLIDKLRLTCAGDAKDIRLAVASSENEDVGGRARELLKVACPAAYSKAGRP